jgi:hypothetical protein
MWHPAAGTWSVTGRIPYQRILAPGLFILARVFRNGIPKRYNIKRLSYFKKRFNYKMYVILYTMFGQKLPSPARTTDRGSPMKTPKIYYAALMAYCACALFIGSSVWH